MNFCNRVGTILGFIISYRTSSSFERYNEGRKLWAQIIKASRSMSRIIWFHVPSESLRSDQIAIVIGWSDNPPLPGERFDQTKARTLIEKKTAINLLEAFAVSVKHYLRGEDGIYYQLVFSRATAVVLMFIGFLQGPVLLGQIFAGLCLARFSSHCVRHFRIQPARSAYRIGDAGHHSKS